MALTHNYAQCVNLFRVMFFSVHASKILLKKMLMTMC